MGGQAMEKRQSYSEKKSWKTGGSNFRATDKQQTYSRPACPPNIAHHTDVVQAWASTAKLNPEPQWYMDQPVGSVLRNRWRCSGGSVLPKDNTAG